MAKKKPSILAVIPARGGSKRVPRKNVRLMAGKPLIYYMIQAGLGSRHITHVALSSEDDEILRVGKKCGGKDLILVKRPKKYATDKAPTLPVVQHALVEIEKKTRLVFDYVVLLQPNSPLIEAHDVDACVEKLIAKKADSVVSVYKVNSYHPVKMKVIQKDGTLAQAVPSMPETIFRRQDLPDVYKRNGGIYAVTRDTVVGGNFGLGFFCGPKTYPYVMESENSIDIDEPADFLLAEVLIKERARKRRRG
jgi:CMP-N-acetylneuraminic acid synthetase